MRKDDADVRVARGSSAKNDLRDCTSCVGAPLNSAVTDIRKQIPATVGRVGVSVNDGITPVKFFKYGIECRIAEPFVTVACAQPHSIGLQRNKGVRAFAQTPV